MNPYSGTSTLAKVLRAAAVGGGIVYGSVKLGYLKVRVFDWSTDDPGGPRGQGDPDSRTNFPFRAERGVFQREEGCKRSGEALIARRWTGGAQEGRASLSADWWMR